MDIDRGTELAPIFAAGDRLSAERFNTLSNAVNRGIRQVNQPRQKSDIRGLCAGQFQITSIEDDSLTCVPFNGTDTTGNYIDVMKPWLLRRTTLDGLSRSGVSYTYTDSSTRTATQGATTETHKITPDYLVGDTILAMACVQYLNEETLWVDLNNDAREWAKV